MIPFIKNVIGKSIQMERLVVDKNEGEQEMGNRVAITKWYRVSF